MKKLLIALLLLVGTCGAQIHSTIAYTTVQDETTNLLKRRVISFAGAGVTCADDPATGRTVCTITGGGTTGYATVQDEGSGLTQRNTLNFIGAGVTCVDNAGSTKTDCTIAGGGGGLSGLTATVFPVATSSTAIADGHLVDDTAGSGYIYVSDFSGVGTSSFGFGNSVFVSDTASGGIHGWCRHADANADNILQCAIGTKITNDTNNDGILLVKGSQAGDTSGISGQELSGVPTGVVGFDILYADSTAHRWKMKNNNGSALTVAALESPAFTTPNIGAATATSLVLGGSQTITGVQGTTGVKLAAATGTFTSGNCVKTDANGNFVDQGGVCGGAGGITTLNTLTAGTQTFAKADDTNVTLTIGSATSTHTFTMGWTGTLAKARQFGTTVYTDQANTFGNFIQTFQGGANHLITDTADLTKKFQFDVSNVGTATTRTMNVPNANATFVQADTGASNNFLTAISAQGVISKAQPAFTNLSGSVAAGQMPALTGDATSTAGTVATTVGKVNGVSYAASPSTDTVPLVTAANTATYTAIPSCSNGVTDKLLYNTTTHVISCGTDQGGGGGMTNPMTTLGDIIYEDATPVAARLAGNTSTTKKFLQQTGNGTISAVPAWGQPAFTDITGTATAAQEPATTVNSVVNDTNVTGSISSQVLTLGWTGTLAKARTLGTTVYTDQANTYSTGVVQTLSDGTNTTLANATTATKKAIFDLANITAANTRTINVPDANSTTIQADTGAANNFLTAVSAQGVISKAQPAFSNISGSVTDAQVPDNITITLAATATALAADGSNCTAGQAPLGVDASGAVQTCTDYMEEPASSGIVAKTAANTSAARTITGTSSEVAVATGDGVSGNPTISLDATVAQTDVAKTWTTAQTFTTVPIMRQDALAATVTNSMDVVNTTVATSPSPFQISPAIHFLGHVWNTTPTAADNFVDWQQYVSVTSGASPTSKMSFRSSLSTTSTPSYIERMSVDSAGTVTANIFNGTLSGGAKDQDFILKDEIDGTKQAAFQLSGITTSTTRTVTIANANSTTVIPDTGTASNFLTAISAGGVISKAQPAFTDISGTATNAQVPTTLSSKTLDNTNTINAKDTLFTLQDDGDATKTANFQLSGITTSTNRQVTIANGASATVIADTGAANNFLTAISAGGVISKAQPALTNLSAGTSADLRGVLSDEVGTGVAMFSPKQDIMDAATFCSDANANDTYTCNLSPAITAYVTGTHYRFKANTANTGAATIDFNSLGAAKTIVKVQGAITTTLADNDIRAGQWVDLVYDGTNMQMVSQLGNAPAGSGTINSGVTNIIPKYTGSTTLDDSLIADDGITMSYTGTGGISASGSVGTFDGLEGTAPSGVAAHDVLYADSTAHRWKTKDNNGTAAQLVKSGVDIDTSDQVTVTHLAAALPIAQGGTNLTTATDDNVMVGNGATWQSKALTTCTDTGGNHVNYDASTNTFSCGTTSSGGAGGAPTITVTNEGTTGTATGKLVFLTGAPATAKTSTTAVTAGIVGICTSGCATTGSATIQISGLVNCVFDTATAAGDYVIVSTTTAGNCADDGASYSSTQSRQVVGRVMTTNGASGTYQIDLFPSEVRGQPSSVVQQILEEGSPTANNRTQLNFIGAAVTAADDNPNGRTNVTFTSLVPATSANAGTTVWNEGTSTSGSRADHEHVPPALVSSSVVTVAVATASDQNLMSHTLLSSSLNVVGRSLRIFAGGTYTTGASGAGTMAWKVKLCTVSGCASGTVITYTFGPTLTATASATNMPWDIDFVLTTVSTGASGTVIGNGTLNTTLGTVATAAGVTANVQTTGASSAIALNGALFIQVSVAAAGASANNSISQRQGVVVFQN